MLDGTTMATADRGGSREGVERTGPTTGGEETSGRGRRRVVRREDGVDHVGVACTPAAQLGE